MKLNFPKLHPLSLSLSNHIIFKFRIVKNFAFRTTRTMLSVRASQQCVEPIKVSVINKFRISPRVYQRAPATFPALMFQFAVKVGVGLFITRDYVPHVLVSLLSSTLRGSCSTHGPFSLELFRLQFVNWVVNSPVTWLLIPPGWLLYFCDKIISIANSCYRSISSQSVLSIKVSELKRGIWILINDKN